MELIYFVSSILKKLSLPRLKELIYFVSTNPCWCRAVFLLWATWQIAFRVQTFFVHARAACSSLVLFDNLVSDLWHLIFFTISVNMSRLNFKGGYVKDSAAALFI